jgi:FkbM family methyltransferase
MTFKNTLKRLLKKIYYIPSILDKTNLKSLIKDPIILVDIGASDGIEEKWEELKDFCHFITFDPDPRAQIPKTGLSHQNFPIGLWSKKDKKILYLKKFSKASTIYPTNDEFLSSFLNFECHKNVGTSEIKLDSLENVLNKGPFPDFIKIDAEGADLEILKGAEKFISSSCLGLQVEVSFVERHKNSAFFSDIEIFLRSFGFSLMDLKSEKWIRTNNVFGINSRAQIIWADAIFLLSKQTLLKRLLFLKLEDRQNTLAKFITILLAYNMHDYAIDICQSALKENLIPSNFINKMELIIRQSIPSKSLCLIKTFSCIMIGVCSLLFLSFNRSLREKNINFIKARTRDFIRFLLNLLRAGPNNSTISD